MPRVPCAGKDVGEVAELNRLPLEGDARIRQKLRNVIIIGDPFTDEDDFCVSTNEPLFVY